MIFAKLVCGCVCLWWVGVSGGCESSVKSILFIKKMIMFGWYWFDPIDLFEQILVHLVNSRPIRSLNLLIFNNKTFSKNVIFVFDFYPFWLLTRGETISLHDGHVSYHVSWNSFTQWKSSAAQTVSATVFQFSMFTFLISFSILSTEMLLITFRFIAFG